LKAGREWDFEFGEKMEKMDRTRRWNPSEMDKKSFRFRVPFILRVLKLNLHLILKIPPRPSFPKRGKSLPLVSDPERSLTRRAKGG
jgi:hypothetical protein